MQDTAAGDATCAALSESLGEPLPGTAAVAGGWLCLEQRGPWGHNALLQSHLDPAVGRALDAAAGPAGVRVQLIRRPGRHADEPPDGPRRAYLAHTGPTGSWLRAADLSDPSELLGLNFAAIAAGRHGGWGREVAEPLLLVCTNGRRDRCCAVLGRELVAGLQGRHGDAVWETTHTGGHRFAPAAVLLPSGYTYGRLGPHQADAALAAAGSGKVTLEHCRGRSTWTRAGQVAELAVRDQIGEHLIDALRVEPADGDQVRVTHQDGRTWTVTVHERELDPPRPNSCGKAAVRPTTLVAVDVSDAPAGVSGSPAPDPPPN
ncbi:hypothetical protein A8924_1755 [Saccharopolyspora erythraea NRRL 2338]|uniref:Sucrase ferredoxin n=1 Tax=Saccharopolyspora erythraea TaxID=1836 RepID=A0ABP3M157_SACER|nr:sucrase ferredoxin [Saccharopolyspora erythraea]EQD87373.1 sucraseferredoxin family protein [Saccharopolyspora erythraea D]PFG94467.1 hypothetical protein A8924_1755 [Saccharopolyspora erythraea NRRL 2338]QRK91224.1 sucrase ferredoxin [Saccharopolyspora erythraea]